MNAPSDAIALEKKVIEMLSKKNLSGALVTMRELIKLRPQDLDLQVRAADLLVEMKEIKKALMVYERVAENFARTGQPLKALKVAKAIQKLDPTYTDVVKFMASRYAGRKEEEPEEAIEEETTPPPPPEEEFVEEAEEVEELPEEIELSTEDMEEYPPEEPPEPAKTAIFQPPVRIGTSELPAIPMTERLEPPAPEALPIGINLQAFEAQFKQDPIFELQQEPKNLPKIPLFSDMGKTAFIRLLDQIDHVIVQPGNDIVVQGEQGDCLYIILEGCVEVLKVIGEAEVPLAELSPGDFFGEMALLGSAERQATVRAIEECHLLSLNKKKLAQVAKKSPSVVSILHKSFRQRLLKNMMKTSPLFGPFDHKTKKELIEKFKYRRVSKGETVIKEGSVSDGLYLVMIGEMNVKKGGKGGKSVNIASLKPGEVFGEISLLTNNSAIASVVAARNSELLRLPAKAFNEMIMTHPQVLEYVSQLSESRIADTDNKVKAAEAKLVSAGVIV